MMLMNMTRGKKKLTRQVKNENRYKLEVLQWMSTGSPRLQEQTMQILEYFPIAQV